MLRDGPAVFFNFCFWNIRHGIYTMDFLQVAVNCTGGCWSYYNNWRRRDGWNRAAPLVMYIGGNIGQTSILLVNDENMSLNGRCSVRRWIFKLELIYNVTKIFANLIFFNDGNYKEGQSWVSVWYFRKCHPWNYL